MSMRASRSASSSAVGHRLSALDPSAQCQDGLVATGHCVLYCCGVWLPNRDLATGVPGARCHDSRQGSKTPRDSPGYPGLLSLIWHKCKVYEPITGLVFIATRLR